FFQAEDGIRDRTVTGVQTCALPILYRGSSPASTAATSSATSKATEVCASAVEAAMCGVATKLASVSSGLPVGGSFSKTSAAAAEIGRASCRERGDRAVGGGGSRGGA